MKTTWVWKGEVKEIYLKERSKIEKGKGNKLGKTEQMKKSTMFSQKGWWRKRKTKMEFWKRRQKKKKKKKTTKKKRRILKIGLLVEQKEKL